MTVVLPLPFGATTKMSYPVCLMDDYLEVETYYESVQQAADYNKLSTKQIISLIKHFPKQHVEKKVRFQFFHALRQDEVWSKHPWLPIYVSSSARVDRDGYKLKRGSDKFGKRKGMDIEGQWYSVDELFYQTYPLLQ